MVSGRVGQLGGMEASLTIPPDLIDAIAQRTAEVIAMQAEAPRYLDVEQAANYLGGWPKKRIYNLTASKEIPHRKHGNRLLFDRAELDRWVANLEGTRG